MTKNELNVRAILAGQAPQDAAVTVKGWVRTRRDSKAGISFVHLTDGSAFHPVQVVAEVLLHPGMECRAFAGGHSWFTRHRPPEPLQHRRGIFIKVNQRGSGNVSRQVDVPAARPAGPALKEQGSLP